MQFQGPELADLANVQSLNLAFFEVFIRAGSATSTSSDPGIISRLKRLPMQSRERIAASPFLIFSLQEHDEQRWQRLFDGVRCADLIDALQRPAEDVARLATATLGFLWQLSKKNSYAVRVISGASLSWCELLAASTLVDLFQGIADEPGLVKLRLQSQPAFWNKLIGAGTSDERSVRCAARMSALQTMLTAAPVGIYRRMPAAACAMPSPPLKVADREKSKA